MAVFGIIPYQELLGNYDTSTVDVSAAEIIPYQELLGNYDLPFGLPFPSLIIPYQELLGNYDPGAAEGIMAADYTIPRAIREL